MCGPADGPDGGPPRHVRHSLGADPPMGRLGAHPLALLDGGFTGPDRAGPYDHPHDDRAVLTKPIVLVSDKPSTILVFYRLNSAIERGTKPDTLGWKPCHWTSTLKTAMVNASRA